MLYINALELIDLSIKNNLLKEENGKVFVYRKGTFKNKEGIYLCEKDAITKELMNDIVGQNTFISALEKIDFIPIDYSWLKSLKISI